MTVGVASISVLPTSLRNHAEHKKKPEATNFQCFPPSQSLNTNESILEEMEGLPSGKSHPKNEDIHNHGPHRMRRVSCGWGWHNSSTAHSTSRRRRDPEPWVWLLQPALEEGGLLRPRTITMPMVANQKPTGTLKTLPKDTWEFLEEATRWLPVVPYQGHPGTTQTWDWQTGKLGGLQPEPHLEKSLYNHKSSSKYVCTTIRIN